MCESNENKSMQKPQEAKKQSVDDMLKDAILLASAHCHSGVHRDL